MTAQDGFVLVGRKEGREKVQTARRRKQKLPMAAVLLLGCIMMGCLLAELIMNHDPSYMELSKCNCPPSKEFYFGTDTLGRDIFSMIWYGGRISLFIGIGATAISTGIAVIYGTAAGLSKPWISEAMMRFLDILLSIPSILLVIFVQALLGSKNVLSLTIVIGLTSFMSMAKLIRTEVCKLAISEYVLVARHAGGGFFYILCHHLIPNFIPTIMFMVVMNVRSAIVLESTLSFLGIGLPIKVISWGSMLSLSEKALMTNSWWIILIPGLFLVAMLLCLTSIGNYIRRQGNQKDNYLQ